MLKEIIISQLKIVNFNIELPTILILLLKLLLIIR